MTELYFRDPTGLYLHSCIYNEYKEDFTHRNDAKAKAVNMANRSGRFKFQRLKIANAMPDELTYFKEVKIGGELYYRVPAGTSSFFPTTESYFGSEISFPELVSPLRDYQTEAVDTLLENSTGLLHAKTATGKTYMMMEMIRRLKRKTLIVTHNLTQMKQMASDVHKILGFYPMYISGTVMPKSKLAQSHDIITVLNIDSHDKLENIEDYGLILMDECHKYVQSEKRRAWVGSLSAEYQYGLTGTPLVNGVNNKVFDIHYGKKTLVDVTLLDPSFIQINTGFQFTMDSMDDYIKMETELYADEERNKIIVNTAKKFMLDGQKGLVFTKRVEHAKMLAEQLSVYGKVYIMIGETSDDDRMRIREEAIQSKVPCIIVGSTEIIGTGFDLPELSFAILSTADRFEGRIVQYVGRLLRPFPGKKAPTFIDISDPFQTMLAKQSKSRLKTFREYFPTSKVTII